MVEAARDMLSALAQEGQTGRVELVWGGCERRGEGRGERGEGRGERGEGRGEGCTEEHVIGGGVEWAVED